MILNSRNRGAFHQFPDHAVLETRCTVDGSGARVIPGPDLPLHQLGLVASVRAAEESIIAAVTEKDRDAAIHGFAIHPLVGSRDLAAALVKSVETDEPEIAKLFS
jgi:6-phospho-beta-glucosidase